MNLSTRLCDVPIGEYIAATQGAGIATSLCYVLVGLVGAVAWRAGRQWWQGRRHQAPASAEWPDCPHLRKGSCYPCWRAWKDAGKPAPPPENAESGRSLPGSIVNQAQLNRGDKVPE